MSAFCSTTYYEVSTDQSTPAVVVLPRAAASLPSTILTLGPDLGSPTARPRLVGVSTRVATTSPVVRVASTAGPSLNAMVRGSVDAIMAMAHALPIDEVDERSLRRLTEEAVAKHAIRPLRR